MVDYMNARGTCPECGEFAGWADGPPHFCDYKRDAIANFMLQHLGEQSEKLQHIRQEIDAKNWHTAYKLIKEPHW